MDSTAATIVTTSVTAMASVFVALITSRKNKNLKEENNNLADANQKLETTIKEVKLISTGMVVGYFFSFIKPLFENIEKSTLAIVDGEKRYPLGEQNARLELYMPSTLDRDSFKEVTSFYKSITGTGTVEDDKGNVLYKKVKYRIIEEKDEAIILIDLPNILNSAIEYYRTPMYGARQDIKDLLADEMTNFKAEIKRLIENAELGKKVDIRQYS